MRVDVSGMRFVFPVECPCCGGRPDSVLTISARRSKGKRVVHTQIKAWDLPYCARCVKHVGDLAAARSRLMWLALLSVILASFIAFESNLILGTAVGITALVGAFWAHKNRLKPLHSECQAASCVSIETSVIYLGWHGTLHRFYFRSQKFAMSFMEYNKKKLVNLSPEARSLLMADQEQTGPDAYQSARRYIS
jgi:hypothetical protein